MAMKRLPLPRDPVQLGKLIVDIATGQVADEVDDGKNATSAEKGRKGAARRVASLTPRQRAEIAQTAAQAQYAAWLEVLPDNLQDGATDDALRAICALDLIQLQAIWCCSTFRRLSTTPFRVFVTRCLPKQIGPVLGQRRFCSGWTQDFFESAQR